MSKRVHVEKFNNTSELLIKVDELFHIMHLMMVFGMVSNWSASVDYGTIIEIHWEGYEELDGSHHSCRKRGGL